MSNNMITPVQKREDYYVSSGASRPLATPLPSVFFMFLILKHHQKEHYNL